VPRRVWRGNRLKIAEGLYWGPFLKYSRAGIFSLFRNSDRLAGWLAPSTGQKNPVQPGWYLPPRKIPLAENRFLQAGNGAENTKEKSRQCFLRFFSNAPPSPTNQQRKNIRLLFKTCPPMTLKKSKGLYSGMGHYERPPGPISFITK